LYSLVALECLPFGDFESALKLGQKGLTHLPTYLRNPDQKEPPLLENPVAPSPAKKEQKEKEGKEGKEGREKEPKEKELKEKDSKETKEKKETAAAAAASTAAFVR